MNPTILTHSGLMFNLVEPDPDLIEIEDIAHALAHICRFTGHTHTFYSVAQHSYLASFCTPPAFALEALLHDAAEAYIGDVSSPLKMLLPDYRMIEFRIEQAIRQRFGLPPKQSPCVKQADLILLASEKRDLMPPHTEEWAILKNVVPTEISVKAPMPTDIARWHFNNRFDQLTNSILYSTTSMQAGPDHVS